MIIVFIENACEKTPRVIDILLLDLLDSSVSFDISGVSIMSMDGEPLIVDSSVFPSVLPPVFTHWGKNPKTNGAPFVVRALKSGSFLPSLTRTEAGWFFKELPIFKNSIEVRVKTNNDELLMARLARLGRMLIDFPSGEGEGNGLGLGVHSLMEFFNLSISGCLEDGLFSNYCKSPPISPEAHAEAGVASFFEKTFKERASLAHGAESGSRLVSSQADIESLYARYGVLKRAQ